MTRNKGTAAAPARELQEPKAPGIETREALVAELRGRYSRGEYRVDARELAARLLRAHLTETPDNSILPFHK